MSTKAKKQLSIHPQNNNGAKVNFMKTICILYALVLFEFVYAQENPWVPKGENPWASNPKNEFVLVEEKDTLPKLSEITLVENDSTKITKEVPLENVSTEKELLIDAGNVAFSSYNSAGDFGAGFTFGLFFNFIGIVPDVVYITSNSKKEKKAIQSIEEDSRYDSLNNEKLTKKVRSKIKSKKAIATLSGTLVGGIVQVGLGVIIIYSIW